MITKAEIKDLRDLEDGARKAYADAKRRRELAEIEMHHQISGLAKGDRILVSRRCKPNEMYFVCRFDPHGWLYANKAKKDGTASLSEVCLYGDWEDKRLVKKATP